VPPPAQPPTCTTPAEAGPTPLRKLTIADYTNTVSDLVGDISALELDFAREPSSKSFPFHNRATEQRVTPVLAGQYLTAAEKIAAHVSKTRLGSLLPCDVAKGDETCAKAFIAAFGAKAFRRPLDDAQSQALLTVYRAGLSDGDFKGAIELVLTAILQMPEFLYRVETSPVAPGVGVAPLDPWDKAARLSYLLWNSKPDDALFAAAAAGQLQTAADVATQAQRMLQDARARAMVSRFHDQWLELDRVETLEKDGQAYPAFTPLVAQAMRGEVRALVDAVTWEGDGKVATLLTAPYTFLNDVLGKFYGVQGLGSAFVRVDQAKLGPRRAAGLLTMGAVLATHASSNQTSPTKRGEFVRLAMLCEELPPPPANVNIVLPPPQPDQTRRQLIGEHASVASCKSCHQLMDPLGFGFENFDASGAWRVDEAGQPVDASGAIVGSDTPGPFNGPEALAAKLASSNQVQTCIATQWFRYAFGRDLEELDACTMTDMTRELRSAGTLGLIRHLTQTAPFIGRTIPEGAQ